VQTEKKTENEKRKKVARGEWMQSSAGIWYVVDDEVQFDDHFSHWKDGLCRLLEITEDRAMSLIELVVETAFDVYGKGIPSLSDAQRIDVVKNAAGIFFQDSIVAGRKADPKPGWGRGFDGMLPDKIFAGSISGNRSRMIVGSSKLPHAWQIDSSSEKKVKAASVAYDENYYQSPQLPHCGMRDYREHADWRMEKARRFLADSLRALRANGSKQVNEPSTLTLLDVGSAIGYFRQAAHEFGLSHYGLDLSEDAIRLCRETFGFDTICGSIGSLKDLAPHLVGKCDLITMWDVIEHLDDPLEAVQTLREFLSDTGVIVLRTPNLAAIEAELLQDMYYSYKLDHIQYFSPSSLNKLFIMAQLRIVSMATSSHIFKGILGANCLYRLGQELRGADIFAAYSK
jgi:2-polyprenyl-3-methyl-5-hydroxy-6-metoxy-1,4-benzoquinol methylase